MHVPGAPFSLPRSVGSDGAREARTQDWGHKIQLSPFPCKLAAAAWGVPVALRQVELSCVHPRWETPPPAHPACQGWVLLQGDIPQPLRLSLTWGRPSRGQAAARSVLARGRSASPGAEVPRESSWGSWERGGDSRGKGQASRQIPACPIRPSTAALRGAQSCPRAAPAAPPWGRAGARGCLSLAALGTPRSPSTVPAWVLLPPPHLPSLVPPGGDVAKALGAKPHPS